MKSLKFLSIILGIVLITGLILAGCGKNEDGNVKNSNTDSTAIQKESQGDTQKIEDLDSNADSIKSKTEDKKAAIEKKLKEAKEITKESLSTMKWSPDGKKLIYATDDGQQNHYVYIWNIEETQPHKANIDTSWGTAFGWSPNSEYVLVEGGTSQIRGITIIDKIGEPINKKGDEISSYETAGIAHPNMKLEQFWSSDSAKIVISQYNDDIIAFPDVEVSGVFDIIVYDVKKMTKKTLLKSTATEYYTIDKWIDNNTIRCNKYVPKNNKLGNVAEAKDIKIN